MTGRLPHLAGEADIIRWADRIVSRSELARLVRGLIAQTNDQVVSLHMRAGEGVGTPGYDGIVEAARATPFVPDGRSVWEMGTGADPEAKAKADYEKRTADPLGEVPVETTFVFVTPRRWGGKESWAADRVAEGVWRDVKVLDVDDIVIALEAAPAVHFWFSEVLDKPAAGVRTLEDWWNRFAPQSHPSLTPGLVLSGRDDHAAELLRLLEQDAQLIRISAPSTDDVLAFVAATILSTPEETRLDLFGRSLIVLDALALRQLDTATGLLILLPFEEELRREALLVRNHHVLLIAPGDVPAEISLPPIDRDRFIALLKEQGVEDDQVGRLANGAHLSLVAFQRQAPASGRQPARDWADKLETRTVRRAWMAGSWTDRRSGDQEALGAFFGTAYEDASEELLRVSRDPDPILIFTAGSWTVVDPSTAWEYGKGQLKSNDVVAFETLVQTVLGAVDPALELPVEERWAAAVFGKSRVHSSDLRRGLARTLALWGALGDDVVLAGGGSLASAAASITFRLLSRANKDASGHVWSSLSDVLPLLAEASPDVFLQAIENGLTGDTPVLGTMFLDNQSNAMTVSSPHTGLLWALETVGWASEHFGRAARALASLARIDPGGRLSNRPASSLADLFRPWLPQTAASGTARLAALDALIDGWPEVANDLMLRLLPESHAVGGFSAKPRFRDWRRDTDGVTRAEYIDFVSSVVDRLLVSAGDDASRWVSLVSRFDDFPPQQRGEFLSKLGDVADRLDEAGRAQVWEAATELAGRHRSYPDAAWSLDVAEVDAFTRAAEPLRPTDPIALARWMFQDQYPDIGTSRPDTFEERDAMLKRRRDRAVRSVLDARGIDGVFELAEAVKFPWIVGSALAGANATIDDARLLPLLGEDSTQPVREAVRGYAVRRAAEVGIDWVDGALSILTDNPLAQARLLLCHPDTKAAIEHVDSLGEAVQDAYWAEFGAYGLGQFELAERATKELLARDRVVTALDLLNLYVARSEPPVSPTLVAEALEEFLVKAGAEENLGRISGYEIEQLLNYVRDSNQLDLQRMATLEWRYLPALGYDARSPTLERQLATDPSFFIEILSLAYRARTQEGESDVPQEVAGNAYHVLGEWRTVPGSDDERKTIDAEQLSRWIEEARSLAAAADRGEVADIQIGHVFAYAPADEDGTWPAIPVRDVLERVEGDAVLSGFGTQIYNKRGVTTRGLTDGGRQEYMLADDFDAKASAIAEGWPRTAASLRSVANGYRAEARRHDEESERYRLGLDR